MFRLTLLLHLLLLAPEISAAAPVATAGRPNIVLILADDLGYGDLGAYGGKDVPTPQIDRLTREGIRFTDAYVTCPACAPSRLSIMGGAYTQWFGMTWNDDRSAHKLPDSQRLLPELLRAQGYRTAGIGKWNIVRPAAQVFDEVHDFIEWESDYLPQSDGRYIGSGSTTAAGVRSSKTQGWGREGDEYLTERLAQQAAAFISRSRANPFFLYVGFNAVHSPWQGRARDRERFAHLPHEVLQLYASMIAALDDGVGQILGALREHQLEENTIVIFLSDNGPAKGGRHIEGWKPEWPAQLIVGSAGPLRGAKTDLFEGGIREPLIVRWPAQHGSGFSVGHRLPALSPPGCPLRHLRISAHQRPSAVSPPSDSVFDLRSKCGRGRPRSQGGLIYAVQGSPWATGFPPFPRLGALCGTSGLAPISVHQRFFRRPTLASSGFAPRRPCSPTSYHDLLVGLTTFSLVIRPWPRLAASSPYQNENVSVT